MSVKKLLAKQEAGFMSLHDVLTEMTKIDDASYQQAATALHRLLMKNPIDAAPTWWTKTILNGLEEASYEDKQDALDCLAQATELGKPEKPAPWDYIDEIPF